MAYKFKFNTQCRNRPNRLGSKWGEMGHAGEKWDMRWGELGQGKQTARVKWDIDFKVFIKYCIGD